MSKTATHQESDEVATAEPSDLERELRDVIVSAADVLARLLVQEMGRSVGGQEVYVPAPQRAARNAAIREFVLDGSPNRGARIAEAARRFQVHVSTVYRVTGLG